MRFTRTSPITRPRFTSTTSAPTCSRNFFSLSLFSITYIISYSYNNIKQSTTGYSPFQIHRGRRVEYAGIQEADNILSDNVTEEKDLFGDNGLPEGVLSLTTEERALPDVEPYQTLLPDLYPESHPHAPRPVHLTSFVNVMTLSNTKEYYKTYMAGEADAYNRRCVLVGSKINNKANKMLDRFQMKSRRAFTLGTKVRVNLNAHKRAAHSARTWTVKDPKKWVADTPHWSKDVYIIDKINNKYGHMMYFVKDLIHEEPLNEPFEYYDLYSCQGITVGSVVRIDLSVNPDYLRSTNAMKKFGYESQTCQPCLWQSCLIIGLIIATLVKVVNDQKLRILYLPLIHLIRINT